MASRRLALWILLGLVLASLLVFVVPWGRRERGAEAPSTIVLVTVDTLRRDRVSAYAPAGGGAGVRTPHLDALASSGVLFEDARTPVPLTLPGHAVMLTGLPPAVIGVRVNAHGRLPPPEGRDYPLLAERLRAAGWRTAAFVSAEPLLASYGLDQGFEHYDDAGLEAEEGGALGFRERPGGETVRRALAYVNGLPKAERLFLWVHLFEPHAPYAPAAPATLPPEARYDLDVVAADAIVGRLLDGLARAGRAEAAVLFTADHGEALGELGERTHGLLLGDAVLRVPFVLRTPGAPPGRRSDPVDLADVAPTLAAIAGVSWPATEGMIGAGVDLTASPAPTDRARVAETLYPHQRYGWAQLLAAVAPDGGTLVDAGDDRLLWLDRAPFGEPQVLPTEAGSRPGLGRLGAALRAYRQGERPERIVAGDVAGGYGHAGRTAPFLPAAENARLPDPYAVVLRAEALDLWAYRLEAGTDPAAVIRALSQMRADDPTNPEISWRLSRAWLRVAERDPDGLRRKAAVERAAEAAREAWERGRQDPDTLGWLIGLEAAEDTEAALLHLRTLLTDLPERSRCRLHLLEARLLRDLDRDDEADEACARAHALAAGARDRHAIDRARADETCR